MNHDLEDLGARFESKLEIEKLLGRLVNDIKTHNVNNYRWAFYNAIQAYDHALNDFQAACKHSCEIAYENGLFSENDFFDFTKQTKINSIASLDLAVRRLRKLSS